MCDEIKPLIESLRETGSQLSALASGRSSATFTDILLSDGKRFDLLNEQLHNRLERIKMQQLKSSEVDLAL